MSEQKLNGAESSRNEGGLYLVSIKGFDGVDWPPRGVAVFRNGLLLGGGTYVYYTGSYSFRDGTIKGELVLNQHTPPPSGHLFYDAKDVGMGVSGTYEGDNVELTGTALVGKRSLMVHLILRKLADA
jgi:T3SS negative regulator,GrlR